MPTSEVVDFHVREYSVSLEYPVDLFFLAPDDIPVIIVSLLPFSGLKGLLHTILEGSLEFNAIS